MTLQEIAAEVAKLSEEERAALASRLLQSLKAHAHEVSDQEVARRIQESEADPSTLITMDELLKGLPGRGS